jgi:hypothetical protein
MASWLEIAKIEMDIADSPDKQIRSPNAWKLQGFKVIRDIFSTRSNIAYLAARFSSAQRLGWGTQFFGADLLHSFLKCERTSK